MTQAARPPALPGWYAAYRPGTSRPAPPPQADAVSIGPLTVYRASQGCEIARFGSTAAPGAALFDGYLLNRPELEEQLSAGARALTDAELAARAYQEWGREAFDRIDGCYLLALWDARASELLIGHDALGRHPVFHAVHDGALWFSPNVLALTSDAPIDPEINRLSLALLLTFYWPEAQETFFARVRRVRPGHYLRVGASLQVSEHEYWHPFPSDEEPWHPDEGIPERFEQALDEAVRRCLRLSPQGIMLSGGLDSVTVAALCADHVRARGLPPLIAVSGQSGHTLSAEEARQPVVAAALGMPYQVSTIAEWHAGRDGIELSLDATSHLPSPSRIYWVGTYTAFYRRTAARHLHVLLTGAGGDNWLGVADPHAADLIRRLRLTELAGFIRADIQTGGGSLRGAARRLLWTSGLRPHVDSLWARLTPRLKLDYHRRKWQEHLPRWLCPDDALRQELVERLLGRRTPPLTPEGRVPRSYYRHSLRTLTNPYMHYENETAYHIENSCGLRLLSPYHDRRFVSFANRISPRALVHGQRYKGLLRPIVARRLPDLHVDRQRKEYEPEERAWQLADLRASLANVWPSHPLSALEDMGVVDEAALRRVEAEEHRAQYEPHIRKFILMSAERWVRARREPLRRTRAV